MPIICYEQTRRIRQRVTAGSAFDVNEVFGRQYTLLSFDLPHHLLNSRMPIADFGRQCTGSDSDVNEVFGRQHTLLFFDFPHQLPDSMQGSSSRQLT